MKGKGKGKGHFYLTSVVPSVPTRLLSMEADGAPSTPLPLSVLRFTGIQSYSYMDQRKVEADVEVTEDRTGDLSLRKPRTSQLSHDCSCELNVGCRLQNMLFVLFFFYKYIILLFLSLFFPCQYFAIQLNIFWNSIIIFKWKKVSFFTSPIYNLPVSCHHCK